MYDDSSAPPTELGPSAEILRRRQLAAATRRRRLLLADLGLALALALLSIVLAPGLAWVAVLALSVLAFCSGWWLLARARTRYLVGRTRTRTLARPGRREREHGNDSGPDLR